MKRQQVPLKQRKLLPGLNTSRKSKFFARNQGEKLSSPPDYPHRFIVQREPLMKRTLTLCLFTFAVTCIAAEKNNPAPVDNGLPYFVTTSIFPLDKGVLEVIVQPEYDRGRLDQDLLLFTSFSYGVTDQWQVYLGLIPYDIHWKEDGERTSGSGDTNFGTQYSWMYINKSQFSASVAFTVTIPTGDINKELTQGFIQYQPSFIWAQDFIHGNWRTQFFGQVGFIIIQRLKRPAPFFDDIVDEPNSAHYFLLNTGIAARGKKINYSLELNWKTNNWNHDGDTNEIYITPGIYYLVRDGLGIGLGVPIGLTQDADRYQIIANLLVDIETLPKKPEDDKKDDDKNEKDKTKNNHYDRLKRKASRVRIR